MALIDRMRIIQNNLKEKQAWEDGKPQRAAEWISTLTALFDVLEEYLKDEIEGGFCTVVRGTTKVNTSSLGAFDQPDFTIVVEKDIFVSSRPVHTETGEADHVDFTGKNQNYGVRLAHHPDQTQTVNWSARSAQERARLNGQGQWITANLFKGMLEPFFRLENH